MARRKATTPAAAATLETGSPLDGLKLPAELPEGVDREDAEWHLDSALHGRDPMVRLTGKTWLVEQGVFPEKLFFPRAREKPLASAGEPATPAPEPERPPRLRSLAAENFLLRGLLSHPEAASEMVELTGPDEFGSLPNRRICRLLLARAEEGLSFDPRLLRVLLGDDITGQGVHALEAFDALLLLEPPSVEAMREYAGFIRARYLEHVEDLDKKQLLELLGDRRIRNGTFLARASQIIEDMGEKQAQAHPAQSLSLGGWPAPASEEALYGIAGRVVRALDPVTEADAMAILFQFLVIAGNYLGRHPCFYHEEDRHGMNLFLVVAGPTAIGAKGGGLNQALRTVKEVDPDPLRDWRERCGLISGEGLIHAVRNSSHEAITKEQQLLLGKEFDPGIHDKRVLYTEREFSSVLKLRSRKASTLAENLRLAWDGVPLGIASRNKPAEATGHHISVITHITLAELQKLFDSEDALNGMGNRFLWIVSRKSKTLDCRLQSRRVNWQANGIQDELRQALAFAQSESRLREDLELFRDDGANDLWADHYAELDNPGSGILGGLKARGKPLAMRMALIYSILDRSPLIRAEHLRAALACWGFNSRCIDFIFGNPLAPVTEDDRIFQAIRSAGEEGMGLNQICRRFFRGETLPCSKVILRLLREGQLREITQKTGGRPRTAYVVPHASRESS